jgi:phosphoribosylglycinamide formyltransferase 1
MIRVGVIASHEGSLLQAVLDACDAGEIEGVVAVVISNNSNSGALRRARVAAVPAVHLSGVTHPDADNLDRAIAGTLSDHRVDWVLLAGYMKKLGPFTLAAYRGRIVNTHPALLPHFGGPGFYGRRVHEAVLAAGDPESGATVHLVNDEYDSGPVVAQVRVPITQGITVEQLEDRVKHAERRLLVDVLAALARGAPATALPLKESKR